MGEDMDNNAMPERKYWFMTYNKDKAKVRNESIGIKWQNPVVYINAGFKTILTGDIGYLIDFKLGDYVFIYQGNDKGIGEERGIYGIGEIVDILYSDTEGVKSARYAVIRLDYSSSNGKPIVSLYSGFYSILKSRVYSARKKWGYAAISAEQANEIINSIEKEK